MEINVIEESKKKLVFEAIGEGHTLCNALKSQLQKNEHVKSAAYTISHPLIAKPIMMVEVDSSTTPREALADAAKELAEQFKEFSKEFEKLK